MYHLHFLHLSISICRKQYFRYYANRLNLVVLHHPHIHPTFGLFLHIMPNIDTNLKVLSQKGLPQPLGKLKFHQFFCYHKYQEYSANGKNIKKYLILVAVSLFYLFYNSFIDFPMAMIPHFLARIWSLGLFLILIKYFWKGNPLSHLFGVLIYFHLDRIIAFINAADPTLKPQGWVLLGLFTIFFKNY